MVNIPSRTGYSVFCQQNGIITMQKYVISGFSLWFIITGGGNQFPVTTKE
jgi:hypothetical protein